MMRPALRITSEPVEMIKIKAEGKAGGERQFAPETEDEDVLNDGIRKLGREGHKMRQNYR